MNPEESDDLWRLLGRARGPRVSSFFARNVVRAIREGAETRSPVGPLWNLLRSRWRIAVIGAAAVAVIGVASFERPAQPDPVMILASRVSASPDLQVISHLDELLDSEQNSVWLDAAAY